MRIQAWHLPFLAGLGVVLGALVAQGAPGLDRIRTIAGTGVAAYAGDGGPATNAQLNNPYGIVRGPDGAIYICEVGNHVVRKLSGDGRLSTVAGTGESGYTGDGGPALKARLNEPYEVRFDRAGHMFFVEMKNHLVRRVDGKTGLISTFAGTGQPGFSGDGGPAIAAQFKQPHSIQFDPEGNLYICDIGNHRIRRVDRRTGRISTFCGTGELAPTVDGARIAGTPLRGPRAIDFDKDGNLWLALREGNAVYKLDLRAGVIRHVAGTGQKGFSGDGGPAQLATLAGPKGLSIGPDGNVYLADTENHSIRRLNLKKGTIELVAGTGEQGDGPDGDPLKCKLSRPHGVMVDHSGKVLVGDSETHRVRVISSKETP